MKPPTCIFCSRLVLELEGQFEMLQGYLVPSDALNDFACGPAHLMCLMKSGWGPRWAELRARHQENMLRRELVGESHDYRIYRDSRGRRWVVVITTGELLAWKFGTERKARRVADGRLVAADEEYNLELPDLPDVIGEVQAELTRTKRYPLLRLIEQLGIADVTAHPEVLADSHLALDRSLRGEWSSTWLSVRIRYVHFVAEEIAATIERLAAG